MNKIAFSFMAVVSLSSFGVAGGNVSSLPVPVVIEADNSGFYIGGTIAYQRTYATDSTWFGKAVSQDETGGLGLLGGYDFNEYVAIEARITTSVFEEDYAEVTTYGIYVKPQYPVTEDFKIYALLGYGNVTVDATDAGSNEFGAVPSIVGNTLMDESGFQWGLGVAYAVTEEIDLFLDYVAFASDAEIDPTPLYAYNPAARYTELSNDALTLGITYKF